MMKPMRKVSIPYNLRDRRVPYERANENMTKDFRKNQFIFAYYTQTHAHLYMFASDYLGGQSETLNVRKSIKDRKQTCSSSTTRRPRLLYTTRLPRSE